MANGWVLRDDWGLRRTGRDRWRIGAAGDDQKIEISERR